MFESTQWLVDRFVGETIANDAQLSPIDGYQTLPLVSLEEALKPLEVSINNLSNYIQIAKQRCYYPNQHCLTQDQSASIYLYTMEWGDNSFYRILNALLRTQDRNTVKPWFLFLKLFDTALKKLPYRKQNVWRGIRSTIGRECKKGDEIVWWSVNSCSLDVHVIESFLSSNSTLFLIEALTARDITGYTKYPNEYEVILPPGVCLHVVANSMELTDGLYIVHLREEKLSQYSKPSTHALQTSYSFRQKLRPFFCRPHSRKPYILIVAILILLGIAVGTMIGILKNKKQPTDATKNDDIWSLNTTFLNSYINFSNTTLTMARTSTINNTICIERYPPVGFIKCRKWATVLSCASTQCERLSVVHACSTYHSNCFIFGETIIDDITSNKWHRINLKAGGYGYVNDVYCTGSGPLCT